MVAESPKETRYIGVLQTMSLPPSSAPIATGWSDSCRTGFAPARKGRLGTAHRRTKTDWAHFLNDIAERHPGAKRITLVMDNLNTHRPGAFYEAFPPPVAKALWDRFEFVYTPKHGSWLNVAEVELSVMIRQCLNRRIASLRVLRDEVAAWQASRDRIQAKVNWQFTTDDARVNLKRLYPTFDE